MSCLSLQYRGLVTLCLVVVFLVECPRECSGNPSSGHGRTQEDGEVQLSPKLFGLTLASCQHTPFCQHLVIACDSSTAGVGTSEDHIINCQDVA